MSTNNFRSICQHLTQIGEAFITLQCRCSGRIRETYSAHTFKGFSGWVVLDKETGDFLIFDARKQLVFDIDTPCVGEESERCVEAMSKILDELVQVLRVEVVGRRG